MRTRARRDGADWVVDDMNNLESALTYEGTVEVHTLVLGQAAFR